MPTGARAGVFFAGLASLGYRHPMALVLTDVEARVRAAVARYWTTLAAQSTQQQAGDADRGGRAAVTGGRQMLGFCEVVNQLLIDNGIPEAHIHTEARLELPGYFRPTKSWDMLVIHRGRLIAALEFKSQRGPSFGNGGAGPARRLYRTGRGSDDGQAVGGAGRACRGGRGGGMTWVSSSR